MSFSISDIVDLYAQKGHEQYDGEPVTQLEHALQTATFAEQAGADCELITASLLHDLGHLLHDFGATPTNKGLDDVHQHRCLPSLRPLFGSAVLGAIALHVDAKRYLCANEPQYFQILSADSQRSLKLQGGMFSADQAQNFISLRYAASAVALRRWDDSAKLAGLDTPDLDYFMNYVEQAAARHNAKLGPAVNVRVFG